jgi:hypothetical protein
MSIAVIVLPFGHRKTCPGVKSVSCPLETSFVFLLRLKIFENICVSFCAPNGVRYLLVGGMRRRYFVGIHFKPRKTLENAQTPTSQVHALLGALFECQPSWLKRTTKPS